MAHDLSIVLSSSNSLTIPRITGGGTTEIIDDLNALTDVVNDINTTVNDLSGRMTTVETDIEDLKARMSSVEGILYFNPE